MGFKVNKCTTCGTIRHNALRAIAPCEACGKTAKTEEVDEETEPGWEPKDLGRKRVIFVKKEPRAPQQAATQAET